MRIGSHIRDTAHRHAVAAEAGVERHVNGLVESLETPQPDIVFHGIAAAAQGLRGAIAQRTEELFTPENELRALALRQEQVRQQIHDYQPGDVHAD